MQVLGNVCKYLRYVSKPLVLLKNWSDDLSVKRILRYVTYFVLHIMYYVYISQTFYNDIRIHTSKYLAMHYMTGVLYMNFDT